MLGKIKCEMKKVVLYLVLFLLFISCFGFAQNKWEPGKAVIEGSKDTISGQVKIKANADKYIKKVLFRSEKTKKIFKAGGESTKPKSAISYFSTSNKKYIYINYTDDLFSVEELNNKFDGWIEMIEEGEITVYKGTSTFKKYIEGTGAMFPAAGGGMMMTGPVGKQRKMYTPMYILQKRNTDRVIIAAPSTWAFGGDNTYIIDEENKDHLISFMRREAGV